MDRFQKRWIGSLAIQVTLLLTPDRHVTHYIGIGRIRPLEFQTTQDNALHVAHGGLWGNKLPSEISQQDDRLLLLRGVYVICHDVPGVAFDLKREANSYHVEGPPEPS